MRTVLATFFGSLGIACLIWFLVFAQIENAKKGERVRLILMLACLTCIAASVVVYRVKPKG